MAVVACYTLWLRDSSAVQFKAAEFLPKKGSIPAEVYGSYEPLSAPMGQKMSVPLYTFSVSLQFRNLQTEKKRKYATTSTEATFACISFIHIDLCCH